MKTSMGPVLMWEWHFLQDTKECGLMINHILPPVRFVAAFDVRGDLRLTLHSVDLPMLHVWIYSWQRIGLIQDTDKLKQPHRVVQEVHLCNTRILARNYPTSKRNPSYTCSSTRNIGSGLRNQVFYFSSGNVRNLLFTKWSLPLMNSLPCHPKLNSYLWATGIATKQINQLIESWHPMGLNDVVGNCSWSWTGQDLILVTGIILTCQRYNYSSYETATNAQMFSGV
jgi:hypothetical protein